MVRENQVIISEDDGRYECRPCNRTFNSFNGLNNHCQKARVHSYGDQWCERCEWLFVSPGARDSHTSNSSRHNLCPASNCNLDFSEEEGLDEHMAADHHWCIDCKRYFNNENELTQHKRVHLPRNIECLGCDRQFSEFAAMILHLEAGTCASQTDVDDLDRWMANSRLHQYVDYAYDPVKYCCPHCDRRFDYLSAFCQHVATTTCEQNPGTTFWHVERTIRRNLR
ncbi:hypothetical protein H2200_010731 [Cladophialophora chaetospira]|uniref:C2H2-type domain-containing protein n=1 Tax=Cladophialophora chaetospira TaxID=386627 RepID=A0AA38X0M9_9EURO|nr:hypothetical protein H2200_010731 [Cladophialophora chaetospira]